jgi:tetratricopeptide (TPR) repeat protein
VRVIRIVGLAGVLLALAASFAAAAESAAALWEAGKKAFADNKFAEAADLFGRAWAIEKNVSYIYSRGSALRRMGENEKAADAYEIYLAAVPPGERPDERPKAVAYAADLRLKVGIALKEAGRCADAIGQFIKSLEHLPAGAPWVYLGLCHEDVGHKDAARLAYEKALAAKDLDPALRAAAEGRLAALRPPGALDGGPPVTARAGDHKKTPWVLVAGVAGGGAVVIAVVGLAIAFTVHRPTVDLGPRDLGVMTAEDW